MGYYIGGTNIVDNSALFPYYWITGYPVGPLTGVSIQGTSTTAYVSCYIPSPYNVLYFIKDQTPR